MPEARRPRGYVICSEHRSGSTLLANLLTSTGVLGRPDEFFRDTVFAARFDRDPSLLEGLLQQASGANGVYGLKVFTQQFDATIKSRWVERLPNLSFIYLERRDLLGQAISLVRALQTGQYHSHQAASAEPRYDAVAIARHIERISDGYVRWRRYFARNGIEPLWLSYEELTVEPKETVERVARFLDVELAPSAATGSDLRIQRDAISDTWRSRFVAERSDLAHLDHQFGKGRVWLRRLARDVRFWLESRRAQ
jgi:trehalose 2-sulfotransferase